MRRPHLVLGGGVGLAGAFALAGLVAAQDANKTGPAPATPATAPAPAAAALPPAVKALTTAATPEEGPPPPKNETAEAPTLEKDDAAPDDTPPPEPLKRPRFAAAVMQASDKLTAQTLRFEAKVGEPVRYLGMVITVRACETTAGDETAPDSVAFLDVQSQPLNTQVQPRQVFRGWMFSSSPSLHPFEHPIYDLWVIACKTSAPVAEAPSAANTPADPAKAADRRS